jgi:hypothetical protein
MHLLLKNTIIDLKLLFYVVRARFRRAPRMHAGTHLEVATVPLRLHFSVAAGLASPGADSLMAATAQQLEEA